MALRKPTDDEGSLLAHLIALGEDVQHLEAERTNLAVEHVGDGGSGSLRLFPAGTRGKARVFGRRVSTWEFTDVDGVEVQVSLAVDGAGHLYELEVWKTNHGRLLSFPSFDDRA